MTLKVFGAADDGIRIIMATRSRTAFEAAINIRRGQACETANEHEIMTAMAQPNIVLIRPRTGGTFEVASVAFRDKRK
jgi:hypothetical protein